jgi:hypothetical protein
VKKKTKSHPPEKISKNPIVPENRLIGKILFCLSIVCFLFLLHKEIYHLLDNIHWGDETLNILIEKNIRATGLPVYGTYKDVVSAPISDPATLTFYYWEYSLEMYLRFPFYLAAQYIHFDWKYWSSLGYVYIILLFLVYKFVVRNNGQEGKFPLIPIAYFLLLLGLSTYSSSQFHYVRYYPFTIISMAFAHFTTLYLFVSSRYSTTKKYALILLIAFIPGLFHMINWTYFFYWLTIIFFIQAYNQVKIFREKKNARDGNGKSVIFLVAIAGVACLLVFFVFNFLKDRVYFSTENIKVVSEFFKFYFNPASKNFAVCIGLLLILLSYRRFYPFEKKLFLLSIGFLIFSLAGLSVAGGKGLIANIYTYSMFFFPILLAIAALMLYTVYKWLTAKVKGVPGKEVVFFIIPLILVYYLFATSFKNYENTARGTTKEFTEIENYLKKDKDCVFITSDNSLYFYAYFPDNKCYLYRTYNEITETNKLTPDEKYKDINGYTRNVYGEYFIGKKQIFIKMLRDNPGKKICFYNLSLGMADGDLGTNLQSYIVNNPCSSDYLNTMFSLESKFPPDEATKRAMEVGIFYPQEYFRLGSLFYEKRAYEESVRLISAGLTKDSTSVNAYMTLCADYASTGQWKNALKAVDNALKLEPGNQQALQNRQLILQNLRN